METPSVEWSVGMDPDLIVEVWSTGALVAAVIEALLEDPERLQMALKALGASKTVGSRANAAIA